ncbi:hypothetical protein EXIGLDRAFT_784262, partial [Exidia glandulosa HHB12029]
MHRVFISSWISADNRIVLALLPLPSALGMAVKAPDPVVSKGGEFSPTDVPLATMGDRHALALDDEMDAFPLDPAKLYPDRARYHVVWRTKDSRTYVAQYALAPVMPPPPADTGPIGCDCRDHWGSTRYGDAQSDLRAWCPDFYREGSPSPFTPDLFEGYGPCAMRSVPGLLSEWTDARTIITDVAVEFDADTVALMAEYHEVAVDTLSYLGVDAVLPVAPSMADTQEDLWTLWTLWAKDELTLRASILERLVGRDSYKRLQRDRRDIWERLRSCGYFDHGPVGVWFARPELYLAQIRLLTARSVPVFYEWTPTLAALRAADFLKPANGAPPSSPRAGVVDKERERQPPPPPCSACRSSHSAQECAKTGGTIKRKGSDSDPPANIDRTKRVIFQEPTESTPPSTPRKATSSAPSTPVRPLSSCFEGVLYPSPPKRTPSTAPPPSGAAALLQRMTSPSNSTLSRDSRENSPAPAAHDNSGSLLARLLQPVPAPALGTIEVIALSDDLNQPLAVETVAGKLEAVELRLLPSSTSAHVDSSQGMLFESALEFRIGDDQQTPRLLIRARGRALEVIKAAEARGSINKWIDCFFVALQYGISIFTGVEAEVTSTGITAVLEAHDVPDLVRVNPDLSPPARWNAYRDGAKRVLHKSSGFRAA